MYKRFQTGIAHADDFGRRQRHPPLASPVEGNRLLCQQRYSHLYPPPILVMKWRRLLRARRPPLFAPPPSWARVPLLGGARGGFHLERQLAPDGDCGVLQIAGKKLARRTQIVGQNRVDRVIERGFDGGAVLRFDFEDLAERRPAVRRGKQLLEHFQPGASAVIPRLPRHDAVRDAASHSLLTVATSDSRGRERGAERVDAGAQFGQTLVELCQPLVEGAPLVFELQSLGREPLGAEQIVFLLLLERGRVVAAAGNRAFAGRSAPSWFRSTRRFLRQFGVQLVERGSCCA